MATTEAVRESTDGTLASDWRTQAVCFGLDPDMFMDRPFEEGQDMSEAVAVCATCPVQTECVLYALEWREVGIWGGTTTRDRERFTGHKRTYPKGCLDPVNGWMVGVPEPRWHDERVA